LPVCNIVAEFVGFANVQHRIHVLKLLLRFVSTYLHYLLVVFLGCGAIMLRKETVMLPDVLEPRVVNQMLFNTS
jgi:hypothetical protein